LEPGSASAAEYPASSSGARPLAGECRGVPVLQGSLPFLGKGGEIMADPTARILLVDDEQSIQTLLSYPLRRDGYEVVQATDGRQALERFEEEPFDLVVLDLMLPRIDGLEVCRRLRSQSSVPIIMLTAKSEEIDKVVGLEIGADDYITKPFSLREFSSRIKAALRRAEMSRPAETAPDEAPLVVRELRIEFPKRTVRVRGMEPQLTYVEFEILSALARAPGRVFTRDMLLARIWGDSAYRDPRTIDVHIRHLREKIERDPKDPEYLFTVRGVGYRFRDTEF
jgi:DNA-binding response OmpR family regulator